MFNKKLMLKAMGDWCLDGKKSGGVTSRSKSKRSADEVVKSEDGQSVNSQPKRAKKKKMADKGFQLVDEEIEQPDPFVVVQGAYSEVQVLERRPSGSNPQQLGSSAGPSVGTPNPAAAPISYPAVVDWENYQLKQGEVAPGVLQVDVRPRLNELTGPSPDVDSTYTLDIRGYEGWLAAEENGAKNPLDCLKAFAIPQDMVAYAEMEDKSLERHLKVQTGRLVSIVCGSVERLRDQRIRLESAQRNIDNANSKASAALEQIDVLKKSADNAHHLEKATMADAEKWRIEVEGCRASEVMTNMANKAILNERVEMRWTLFAKDEELSAKDKEIAGLKAQVQLQSSVPSYVESVKRFMTSDTFKLVVNREAGPSFREGYEAGLQFVGEGNVYRPRPMHSRSTLRLRWPRKVRMARMRGSPRGRMTSL